MKSVIMLAGPAAVGCSLVPQELVYEPETSWWPIINPPLQGMEGKPASAGVASFRRCTNEQDQQSVVEVVLSAAQGQRGADPRPSRAQGASSPS